MKGWKLPDKMVKYQTLIKALVMMFLPLVCCMVTCALDGQSLGNVYSPSSELNDELFYYKQVEAILQYGIPQGYFGFNESHALKLSFAAWSPVLLFPWLLWGLVFGWNVMSPIYCNIFMMMLAVFLFVYLVKPTWKQSLWLAVMYAAATPLTRYVLSYMAEAICFSLVIIFFSLAVSYVREEKNWKLILMTILVSVMTLMRPYLILFLAFTAWFWFKKHRVWGSVLTVAVSGVTAVAYWAIGHYLAAPYFNPLFDTTWLEAFFTEGIFAGIKYTLYTLWDKGTLVLRMMVQSFLSCYNTGAQFAGFALLMLVLWWQSFRHYRKKEWKEFQIYFPLALGFLGIFTAVVLMYQPAQGGRHLLTFIAVGVFALCVMETKFYRKVILVAGVFAYLYIVMIADAAEMEIPYRDEARAEALALWETVWEEKVTLEKENAPTYDNVVIWTVEDYLPDGTRVGTKWQELYAVPAGFGVSCCYYDYVAENLENLRSKYLALPVGGTLEQECVKAGFTELGRSRDVVIYITG